jgi:uncharacterized Zn-binding protein involved in type VI secretion
LGDYTTHGGTVVSANGMQNMYGKPQAVVGDHCTCPLHGPCVIVEGAPEITFNGKPTAWQGHMTSCGATLISSLAEVSRNPTGGAEGHSGGDAGAGGAASQTAKQETHPFDEKCLLTDGNGYPLKNCPFTVKTASGSTIRGKTDAHGYTPRIKSQQGEAFNIFIGHRDDL